MFETTVVKPHGAAAPRRAGLFTASLAIHSLVVVAAIVASVRSTRFPVEAPRDMPVFAPVIPLTLPPALGRHDAPPKASPSAVVAPAAKTASASPITAPAAIPDTTTLVTATGNAAASAAGEGSGEASLGRADGVPEGIGVGEGGGTVAGVGSVPLQPGGEVRPAVVLHRVQPEYPRLALVRRITGSVKIRCIIDQQGNIRDAEVIGSSFGAFEEPALDAVRQWRFAPGSYRGQPVDTWFELTVNFTVR